MSFVRKILQICFFVTQPLLIYAGFQGLDVIAKNPYERDPASLVQNVSVIQGAYVDFAVDLFLPAPRPISLTRSYNSQIKGSVAPLGGWQVLPQSYFSISRDEGRTYADEKDHYVYTDIFVGEANGSILQFSGWLNVTSPIQSSVFSIDIEENEGGICNTARGKLSALTNLKNAALIYSPEDDQFTLKVGSGVTRSFKPSHEEGKYALHLEVYPSGNKTFYEYDEKNRVSKIYSTNSDETKEFGSIQLEYAESVIATSSDGKRVEYQFSEDEPGCRFLTRVVSAFQPDQTYQYQSVDGYALLTHKELHNGQVTTIDYNDDNMPKVERITQSCTEEVTATTSFSYEVFPDGSGTTEVIGSLGKTTRYQFDENARITSLEQDLNGKLYRRERKEWGKRRDEGNLMATSIEDGQGNTYYYKSYSYDVKGNILAEKEYGNFTGLQNSPISFDSAGHPSGECHEKKYVYSKEAGIDIVQYGDGRKNNLIFHYQQGTDILLYKAIMCKGKLKKRHFYEYQDGILVRTVVDGQRNTQQDDRSYRFEEQHITSVTPKQNAPNLGFPEVIEERYLDVKSKEEVLLKKTVNHFDDRGFVITQDVYDANNRHTYTIEKQYDDRGRLIYETDPLGNPTKYTYDEFNNVVCSEQEGSEIIYQYNLQNLPTSIVRKGGDGQIFESYFTYDAAGNKISEVDHKGRQTDFTYDALGRLLHLAYPSVLSNSSYLQPTYTYEYDIFDYQVKITNSEGHSTSTAFNVRGKPTAISRYNGAEEKFIYNVGGTLHHHQGTDGIVKQYDHDYQGRVKNVEFLAIHAPGSKYFRRDRYYYDAFRLMSSEVNGEAVLLQFDGAGRTVQVTTEIQNSRVGWSTPGVVSIAQGNRIERTYDPLGRMTVETRWKNDHQYTKYCKDFDVNNRVVKEWIEDKQGAILQQSGYEYNHLGQLITVLGYPHDQESRLMLYEYDGLGRRIKETDSQGHVKTIDYDDHVIDLNGHITSRRIETDPMGNQTETLYNGLGSISDQIKRDANGLSLSHKTCAYDLLQNRTKWTSQTVRQGQALGARALHYTYDNEGMLNTKISAPGTPEKKAHAYTYNEYGALVAWNMDGSDALVEYMYDEQAQLKEVVIGGVNNTKEQKYQFSYDNYGNPETIKLNYGPLVKAKYCKSGRLIEETIDGDLSYSSIKKKLNYTTSYEYDGEGCVSCITLPDGSFIKYEYQGPFVKKIIRCSSEQAELYQHAVTERDQMGHVIQEKLIGMVGMKDIRYDSQGRAIGIIMDVFTDQISHDSCGNLLAKMLTLQDSSIDLEYKYNALHQLIEETGVDTAFEYDYDSLGNRLQLNETVNDINILNQLTGDNCATYKYDDMGCLQAKHDEKGTTLYRFDSLGRMIKTQTPDELCITYTYDPSGRRVAKHFYVGEERTKSYHYFYLGAYELGALDDNGNIVELRIPDNPNHPVQGGVIAIELDGQCFAPLQDLQGNICCLIDPYKRKIVESYQYSAFGLSKILDAKGNAMPQSLYGNPWLYRGKRFDSETGLSYFGRRYYDALIGRWISPDPAGEIDGLNLYAYVNNNPFRYVDHYGLEAVPAANCGCVNHDHPGYVNRPSDCICICDWVNLPSTYCGILPGESDMVQSGVALSIPTLNNARIHGLLQAGLGALEVYAGMGLTLTAPLTWGATGIVGGVVMAHGMDQMYTGLGAVVTGYQRDTLSEHLLQKAGMSPNAAYWTNNGISVVATAGGALVMRGAQLAASSVPSLYGNNCNRANYEKYLDSLRAQMDKPYVVDQELSGIMNRAYRSAAQIGSGSTAAAIRYERVTREAVCGKMHIQKGQELIRSLNVWLAKNPTASPGDRAAAENVIKDLMNALGD